MSIGRSLLLFPCSSSKDGYPPYQSLPRHSVLDFLSPVSSNRLRQAREQAFEPGRFPGVAIDLSSPMIPALWLYTGNTYKVDGLRSAVMETLTADSHSLIISGGYGLVRPEEPIHRYEAPITKTKRLWRPLLASLIEDYAHSCQLTTVLIACSKSYADVLKGQDWKESGLSVYWHVPTVGKGEGAMAKVPRLVGEAIVDLVKDRLVPDHRWQLDPSLRSNSAISWPALERTGQIAQSTVAPHPTATASSGGNATPPRADDFRTLLGNLFRESEMSGASCILLRAGDLHRKAGGYPGPNHRMPVCCEVMYSEFRPGDEVISKPPSGKRANLTIRYRLPR